MVNGVLVAAVAVSGVLGYETVFASASAHAAGSDVTVSYGTVSYTVEASGTLAAERTDDATFGASGTIKKLDVASGATVTKGEVLASRRPRAPRPPTPPAARSPRSTVGCSR